MFTGLIEATGRIVGRKGAPDGLQLWIESRLAGELKVGESLAVNGVCLTVVTADTRGIRADVGPETIRVTTLGRLPLGATVNLERPLRADGRFGGHFVQGHVDALGVLERRRPEADFEWLTFGFPPELAPYIVRKGSIAVDGISLTVAALQMKCFDVQIVPFTLEHTNLRGIGIDDQVNLECDLVGKYVARAAEVASFAREA